MVVQGKQADTIKHFFMESILATQPKANQDYFLIGNEPT